VLYYIHQLC